MYEIVGGLRASLLSAVKELATWSGVAFTHINPQYFIHDVMGCLFFQYSSLTRPESDKFSMLSRLNLFLSEIPIAK
jgi:hypothetical protein